MNVHIKQLAAGSALLFSLGLLPMSTTSSAHAGSSPGQDPCAIPLPRGMAMGGGPGTTRTVRSAGSTFYLHQFRGGLGQELRLFHVKPVPNDNVSEFDLVLAHREHIYAGPVHVFRHGARLHVCRSGAIMVDARGNTTQQTNPYAVYVSLDGIIIGSRAWINVWVGRTYSRLQGAVTTRH